MSAREEVHLRGITWNHTRGLVPMVAAAQRFEELNPGVRIPVGLEGAPISFGAAVGWNFGPGR